MVSTLVEHLRYRQLGGKILYRESDIESVLQSCYRGQF